jgi:hypothetical protein
VQVRVDGVSAVGVKIGVFENAMSQRLQRESKVGGSARSEVVVFAFWICIEQIVHQNYAQVDATDRYGAWQSVCWIATNSFACRNDIPPRSSGLSLKGTI